MGAYSFLICVRSSCCLDYAKEICRINSQFLVFILSKNNSIHSLLVQKFKQLPNALLTVIATFLFSPDSCCRTIKSGLLCRCVCTQLILNIWLAPQTSSCLKLNIYYSRMWMQNDLFPSISHL